MVQMQYDIALADPLVEVRDVVESFRCCGVTPADWHQVLDRAIATLDRLPQEVGVEQRLPDLLPHLRTLLAMGLGSTPKVLDQVAAQVATALQQAQIPGIPRPDEEDWSFNQPTVS
jgi:hypothetical protein